MKHEPTRLKILMVGPVPPHTSSPRNPIGGTGVHFLETIRELHMRDVSLQVVNTTRPRTNMGRLAYLLHAGIKVIQTTFALLKKARSCDVVFVSFSAGRAWLLGSLSWLICKFLRRPLMLRIFGGEFNETYDRYSSAYRWLANRTFMRCDRIYVQTQAISQRFDDRSNVQWFPNTRDVRPPSTRTPVTARRFLFVAQLRREKGLYETLEACRDLPHGCRLTVFGPRIEPFDKALFDGHDKVSYGGVLRPQEVPVAIAEHDVVLLPTYFASEGYPGIIIEAFQCGRPVISTWWRSIPELVQHQENGLLVSPRSSTDLSAAMLWLADDRVLYQKLSTGARKTGELFRSAAWYDSLVDDIASLCSTHNSVG